MDPEVRVRLAQFRDTQRLLARAQVHVGLVETVRERQLLLRYAAARAQAAERDLAEAMAGRSGPVAGPSFDLAEGLAALPPGTALAAFVRFGEAGARGAGRYGAFVAPADAAGPRYVDLGASAEIDDLAMRWRSALLDDPAEELTAPLGGELRRLLWEPVAAAAGASTRLFIIPDGAVHLLPFEALPGARDGSFLVEEGPELHRLVTERDLLRFPTTERRQRTLLAIGGPDFDAAGDRDSTAGDRLADRPAQAPSAFDPDTAHHAGLRRSASDPCDDARRLYFPPLPGAREEAAEIVSIFRSGQADGPAAGEAVELEPELATETAFARLAGDHSVLHIATHGFFDLECGGAAGSARGADPLTETPGEAGVVSGLALAGANRYRNAESPSDDGLLTVPEIAALDLSDVDWVVLSACQTALGPVISGEGVLGLARGFRLAGARSLVLSLWLVDDQPTREWMRELYAARFARGEPTATAMRSASLAILTARRAAGDSTHPYYWAAFVATGDWS